MPVNETHPAYDYAVPGWQLCRDVDAGSRAVKSKKTRYLPKPSAGWDRESYSAYLLRAAIFPP